ncbi:MAG: ABC transporter ATP-binding protein [Gammaproteobacteria bacterium]|nr:MAG: ABC transporter ATP-binding protein [Gammaproteobacteria bacterium]
MEHIKNNLPAISLRDVKFGWNNSEIPLLDIENLQVARNEHVFLHGSSGSGKSTLLNILAGINVPQYGNVEILGESLINLSPRKRDQFRAQHMGIIFQQFNLISYLSVLDNLMLRAEFSKQPKHEATQKAQELIFSLGLSDLADKKAQYLSVGQQQRVAVARALINSPEIIIADEPTSALDSDNRDAFMELLFESATSAGSTIVFVSHDKSLSHFFNRSLEITSLSAANENKDAIPC